MWILPKDRITKKYIKMKEQTPDIRYEIILYWEFFCVEKR